MILKKPLIGNSDYSNIYYFWQVFIFMIIFFLGFLANFSQKNVILLMIIYSHSGLEPFEVFWGIIEDILSNHSVIPLCNETSYDGVRNKTNETVRRDIEMCLISLKQACIA
jgi:hypothetical protein